MRYSLIFFFTLISFSIWAQTQKIVNENPLTIKARIHPDAMEQGANSQLTINLELAPHHHAYLDQFKLEVKSPISVKMSQFTINPVVTFHDKFSKRDRQGVEIHSQMTSTVEIPDDFAPGPQKIDFQLSYQACTKDYCLFPKSIPFSVNVQVLPSPETLAKTPPAESKGIFAEALNKGWFYTFLFVFLAGVLTSFTPCIFPMIPITLTVIGAQNAQASKWSGFSLSLSYVFGIAFTYAILGVIAASTGALFGSFLGHPAVAIAIAVVFFIMGLSLLGVFELQAPAFIRNKVANTQHKGGYYGAFLAGLAAGVIASPCVGPVLVGILTYVAKTQNLGLGFALLFVFAMGLGQIFLVLGTFSQAIKKLPRSGLWMVRVKQVFAGAMFVLSFYYVSPLLNLQLDKYWAQFFGEPKSMVMWEQYSTEGLARAQQKQQPVIFDFYADWCLSCKELETLTFSNKTIQEFTQKNNFVWMQFNATQNSPLLEELRKIYDIKGLPHVVLIDKTGEWQKDLTLTGFEKSEEFLSRLKKLTP